MNKPSRRAVVRTGVWAVPVVGTAAAARASAGTGEPPRVTIDGIGRGCSFAGEIVSTLGDVGSVAPCTCHPKDGDASAPNANCS